MAATPSDPLYGGFSGGVTSIGMTCMNGRADHTLSFAPANGMVCEVGVGRGVLANRALARGYRYLGVDIDEAVRLYTSADVVIQLAPPLPDMDPDIIVMESLLEHMPDYGSAKALIVECYEKLQPGGRVVIRVPEIRYAKWRFWDGAPDHAWVTSTRRVTTVARMVGFQIIEHGLYLDQFTGISAKLVYWCKSLWPWQTIHNVLYEPWQESAFSKIHEKIPSAYIVLEKM